MLNGFLIQVQEKLQIRLKCTLPNLLLGRAERGQNQMLRTGTKAPAPALALPRTQPGTVGGPRTETAPGTLTCMLWLPAASLCTRSLLVPALQHATRTSPVLPWEPQLAVSSGFFATQNAMSRTASPAEGALVLCNWGRKAIRTSGWLARGSPPGGQRKGG